MRLDRTGRAYLIARTDGTQIDVVEGEAAVVDEVGFVVRQPKLSTILREESQLYSQLILASTQRTSRARSRSYRATHFAGGGSSRLRATELLLNDLRRANLWDEGVARFDDDAVLERCGDLEAIGIFDPSCIGGDASHTPAPDRIEEAHLAPYLYIVRVMHRGEE